MSDDVVVDNPPAEAETVVPEPGLDDEVETLPVLATPETLAEVGVDIPVIPGETEFRALAALAVTLCESNLVPAALRNQPHDVLLVLMTARDLGVSPTVALRKMYPLDGQVTIAPALKNALVRMKGLGRVYPDPDNNATSATAHAVRFSDGPEVYSYTVTLAEMAKVTYGRKGQLLVEKDNWRNYTARMLWWRASGYLVDDVFPEVAFGLYSPDELGGMTDEDGRIIVVTDIEQPPGFVSSRPPEPELLSDIQQGELRARIAALPEPTQAALRELWKQRQVVPVAKLRVSELSKVDTMIAHVSKDAPEEAPREPAGSSPTPDTEENQTKATPNGNSDGGPAALTTGEVADIHPRQMMRLLEERGLPVGGSPDEMRDRLAAWSPDPLNGDSDKPSGASLCGRCSEPAYQDADGTAFHHDPKLDDDHSPEEPF